MWIHKKIIFVSRILNSYLNSKYEENYFQVPTKQYVRLHCFKMICHICHLSARSIHFTFNTRYLWNKNENYSNKYFFFYKIQNVCKISNIVVMKLSLQWRNWRKLKMMEEERQLLQEVVNVNEMTQHHIQFYHVVNFFPPLDFWRRIFVCDGFGLSSSSSSSSSSSFLFLSLFFAHTENFMAL